MTQQNNSQIIIYQTEPGQTKIDVRLEDETFWLTQDQMAQLFGKSKKTISEHIVTLFKKGELLENSVVRKFRTTATDRKNYDMQPWPCFWLFCCINYFRKLANIFCNIHRLIYACERNIIDIRDKYQHFIFCSFDVARQSLSEKISALV
jgi:hypothetical protein